MLGGILFGLGASASWAVANVAVQRAGRAVGALRALFWAQLVGILLAGVAATVAGDWAWRPSAAVAGWLAVAAAAALLGYACLFYAFEHGRLTVAVPLASSWAVLAAALSLVLFHERLTTTELAGAAVVVMGAIVVSRFAQSAQDPPARGEAGWLLAAAGAAVGFGVLIPAMRRLSVAFGPVGTVAVIYLADSLLALPLAVAFRVDLAPPRGRAWAPVAGAALFETAGSACITLGARHAPLSIVAPLASLAAAFTVFSAWAFLGERPPPGVLLGAALVSAGVVVLAL